jgi:hypothetical protein
MATLDSTLERFWSKVRVSDGCWLCVNPDHLFVGTYADNTADMMRKGRHYRQKNPLVVCKNGHPASERKHGKGCYRCQLDRGARLRRLERQRRRVDRYAGL